MPIFMKNKMGTNEEHKDTDIILNSWKIPILYLLQLFDDYDCEALKKQALKTAQDAYSSQISRINFNETNHKPKVTTSTKEHCQPDIFVGKLKSYQLKGMNWLANLYYFGINGILADEMGLGKTVQSVAFLAHICEEYDTWGPFLIITPASTLHNWTCEISRFVPSFKVVPYWGNPEERKNLRKFFDGKGLGTRDASFHVVVTSYQLVIQDFKFLNRLKWNYMVLDEAQAIKSINSQRWKQLLGFSCRNRLLLSGTPIQNSMAELWALLHFIMPSLFDSHNWFNEWFSKDIEGHVENKTTVDEKHLNRLHMILKPFMLRRVKTEVENELSDKIEVMMYCPLTLRQKYLYDGLKNKISIEELLRSSMNNLSFQSVTNSLMNLVMQFRKVSVGNHPELLERREVKSPFTVIPEPYLLPKLLYRESLFNQLLPSRNHLINNHLSIFHPDYVYHSLKHNNKDSCFSFLRFIDMSVGEFSNFISGGLCASRIKSSPVLSDLVFTSFKSNFYTFSEHTIHFVPESHAHRLMRCQKLKNKIRVQDLNLDINVKSECDDATSSSSPLLFNGADDEDSDMKPFGNVSSNINLNLSLPTTPNKIVGSRSPTKSSPTSYLRSPRKTSSKHSIKAKINIKKEEVEEAHTSFGYPEFPHLERDPILRTCQATTIPTFLLHTCPKAHSMYRECYAYDMSSAYENSVIFGCCSSPELSSLLFGSPQLELDWRERNSRIKPPDIEGLWGLSPKLGWNRILIPDKHTLIMDAGKLYVLDSLLSRLKAGNHRVLIYSQMTKMIDLLEDLIVFYYYYPILLQEYMWHRKHKYMRLDGSSKISDRRDMVEDFQNKYPTFKSESADVYNVLSEISQ
ncbi:putative DNA helicase Ino80 [Armadillidium nasatum]|uniref:Chromatin-remodeling ATPase INO80 n=1 Tax=Armadillidium nasatum TaxID=96803 RepID=A0A5N5TF75_9CRUS|nr:putative DNA helicase Ino80 [Armadillidium nasatum]